MIFHAIQTFGRFFTKIKTSFGILFDKIQKKKKKYHILILNTSINP